MDKVQAQPESLGQETFRFQPSLFHNPHYEKYSGGPKKNSIPKASKKESWHGKTIHNFNRLNTNIINIFFSFLLSFSSFSFYFTRRVRPPSQNLLVIRPVQSLTQDKRIANKARWILVHHSWPLGRSTGWKLCLIGKVYCQFVTVMYFSHWLALQVSLACIWQR